MIGDWERGGDWERFGGEAEERFGGDWERAGERAAGERAGERAAGDRERERERRGDTLFTQQINIKPRKYTCACVAIKHTSDDDQATDLLANVNDNAAAIDDVRIDLDLHHQQNSF